MHAKHMGVDTYFCGSIINLLVYVILPEAPAVNISKLFDMIKEEYTKGATRYQNLRLKMIWNESETSLTSYPKLKGRAAEAKHMVIAPYKVCVKLREIIF